MNIRNITWKRYIHLFRKALFIFCMAVLSKTGFGQSNYVLKYKPIADSLNKISEVPAKLILAIAVIESSAGTGRNSKLLNNHFGFVGKNDLLRTKGIRTMYKQYASAADSYADFVKYVTKRKYYQKLRGNPSCEKWIDEISRHGYSTDPETWRREVLNSLRRLKI
jgi:Bax protein